MLKCLKSNPQAESYKPHVLEFAKKWQIKGCSNKQQAQEFTQAIDWCVREYIESGDYEHALTFALSIEQSQKNLPDLQRLAKEWFGQISQKDQEFAFSFWMQTKKLGWFPETPFGMQQALINYLKVEANFEGTLFQETLFKESIPEKSLPDFEILLKKFINGFLVSMQVSDQKKKKFTISSKKQKEFFKLLQNPNLQALLLKEKDFVVNFFSLFYRQVCVGKEIDHKSLQGILELLPKENLLLSETVFLIQILKGVKKKSTQVNDFLKINAPSMLKRLREANFEEESIFLWKQLENLEVLEDAALACELEYLLSLKQMEKDVGAKIFTNFLSLLKRNLSSNAWKEQEKRWFPFLNL